MTKDGGEVKHSHAIKENLDLLYTLDPHDDFDTNDEERLRMKKYIEGVMAEFLTKRQQQVIKMYYGESLNSNEIALQLGISPQVVRRIAANTMRKIQRHIKIFLLTHPK